MSPSAASGSHEAWTAGEQTDRVIARVQRSGECWMGAMTWLGLRRMRISVSSWRSTEADVDRSVAAIVAVMEGVTA